MANVALLLSLYIYHHETSHKDSHRVEGVPNGCRGQKVIGQGHNAVITKNGFCCIVASSSHLNSWHFTHSLTPHELRMCLIDVRFKRSRSQSIDYSIRGNFRVWVIFALLSSSRKLPPRENKTHIYFYERNRSSIVKITPTWSVLPTFSWNFPPAKITTFTVMKMVFVA